MPSASAPKENMQPGCERLAWDSEFFGFPIARIHGRLTQNDIPAVNDWCASEHIRCAYFLAASDDCDSLGTAERNGFHLADVRITLERSLAGEFALPAAIRSVTRSDIPQIVDIARHSHSDSRFYFDPGFPRERCDALYGTWAEKSCNGYADAVFVAEQHGKAAGYITCHDDKTSGRIGLVGVAEWARGAGLGRQLIDASLHFFASRKLPLVTVVTQGRNIGAQRLYQKSRFLTRSLELWYHRWF